MRSRSLFFSITCHLASRTWTRPWLALALSLSALAAGCGPEGTFDIGDLRASHLTITVGAAGPAESARRIDISIGLPPPPETCHQIPGDLDVTVNDNGAIGEGLTIDGYGGHVFTLGCTAKEIYSLEGEFLVPAADRVLTVKLEKDGEEIGARVTLPPDPPVAVAVAATELGQDSPIAVDLRTTPNVLSSDATCWSAVVISRVGDASSGLSVSSAAIEGGVRLQFTLPGDAPPLPPGPATLMISAWRDERCNLPVVVSCQGVASCSVARDFSRELGPFDVRIR